MVKGLRFLGFRFTVYGVKGLRLMVKGLGFRVKGLGLRVEGLRYRI